MRKIIEEVEGEGLNKFLGSKILLMCGCYFYAGILSGINETCVLLKDASIVYETGEWTDKSYKDAQKLPGDGWYVQISNIESFGAGL
jgi:hypothetical protein